MRSVELLKFQLKALQGNCAAMIQTTQSILEIIEDDEKSPDTSGSKDEECPHEQRYLNDARTMGHQTRWVCTNCGEYVDVEEGNAKLLTTVT